MHGIDKLKLLAFSTSIFMLLFTSNVTAQITIGTNELPVGGALLQLKDKDGVLGVAENATKGMLMPRVELNDPISLADINPGSTLRPDPKEHIGLVVYNVKESDELCKGLHTWDGKKWALLETHSQDANASYNTSTGILIDRDGESYTTANFGDAGVWMTQNLRTKTFMKCGERRTIDLNGSSSEHLDSDQERQYAYPNVLTAPCTDPTIFNSDRSIGLLYNWCAATSRVNATKDDELDETEYQGMCPVGWHVGTLADWRALHKELDKNTSKYSSLPDNPTPDYKGVMNEYEAVYHTVAMLTTKHNPLDPTPEYQNIGKSKGYDDRGFDAIRGGYGSNGVIKSSSPHFLYSNYWTGSNRSDYIAYYHTIDPNLKASKLSFWNKRNLFFIRCKKND